MQENIKDTGLLTINLGALAENYRLLKEKIDDSCIVAGIVKANAYGLGVKPVVHTLIKQKCSHFFVATLDEALEFRRIDKNASIAVLGGFLKGADVTYSENNILPVINNLNDLERWNKLALKKNTILPTILHFDTAMNRLGFSEDETRTLIKSSDLHNNLDIQWVMSHFACADDADQELTLDQAQKFNDIAKHFPMAKTSLGNSSGMFRNNAYHTDMVRPGIALYGGNPTPETKNPMKQVVSLKARILQTRLCQKGKTIGYGASHKFEKDTRTATIAIGYADGFLRSNSNKGQFYYQNQPCPILGRISMDLTTIDISNCCDVPNQGDWVEIIGKNQTIDDLANNAGTISYEILTSLGSRFSRQYIE